jgi:predicted RNA-binding protein YlxR (DUF448 family)
LYSNTRGDSSGILYRKKQAAFGLFRPLFSPEAIMFPDFLQKLTFRGLFVSPQSKN